MLCQVRASIPSPGQRGHSEQMTSNSLPLKRLRHAAAERGGARRPESGRSTPGNSSAMKGYKDSRVASARSLSLKTPAPLRATQKA